LQTSIKGRGNSPYCESARVNILLNHHFYNVQTKSLGNPKFTLSQIFTTSANSVAQLVGTSARSPNDSPTRRSPCHTSSPVRSSFGRKRPNRVSLPTRSPACQLLTNAQIVCTTSSTACPTQRPPVPTSVSPSCALARWAGAHPSRQDTHAKSPHKRLRTITSGTPCPTRPPLHQEFFTKCDTLEERMSYALILLKTAHK
jgi:hypothetical protein